MKLKAYIAALLSVITLLLSACGSGGDSDNASFRIVNATLDYGAIDIYFDDKLKHSAVEPGSTSAYLDYSAKSATLKVTRHGSTSAVFEATVAPTGGAHYSYVVYGGEGSLRTSLYSENEPEAGIDKSKVRILNASYDVGTLDFYASSSATQVTDLLVRAASIAPATPTSWTELDKGSYRVWLTAPGDKGDIRLEIPAIALDDRKLTTIVVMPSTGGALVNAQVLPQRLPATSVVNSNARLRLVAGLVGGELVSVNSSGTERVVSNTSPSISNYVLVPTSTTSLSIAANANPVTTLTTSLVAGSDNTLLVYGNTSTTTATAKLIADNNRLPSQSSKTSIRLVNAFAEGTGGLTLSTDYLPVASGVALGAASAYSAITGSTYSRIDVTETGVSTPLYLATDITISSSAVYSLFQLGTRAAPIGVLRKDR
jgi:Domain of unknown function (DUF4397)